MVKFRCSCQYNFHLSSPLHKYFFIMMVMKFMQDHLRAFVVAVYENLTVVISVFSPMCLKICRHAVGLTKTLQGNQSILIHLMFVPNI